MKLWSHRQDRQVDRRTERRKGLHALLLRSPRRSSPLRALMRKAVAEDRWAVRIIKDGRVMAPPRDLSTMDRLRTDNPCIAVQLTVNIKPSRTKVRHRPTGKCPQR